MLPQEQLVNSLLYKRAGLFDLYGQQSNLGGSAFTNDEDPLTSLLGAKFNEKYRNDYADTLHSGIFGSKNRLTSRTGARLLNDINEMNDRGLAALNGLISNKDRSLKWIKSINDSRVGVGGYTQEAADRDYKDIADKINFAARLKGNDESTTFNWLAKKFIKGKLTSTIDSLKGAMGKVPTIAKPFVTDISSEFRPKAKVQSTSATGKVDEGQYSGKTDKKESNDKANFFSNLVDHAKGAFKGLAGNFSGAGNYLLPALLLGALGGGANKMLRGGSFMGPLLLMALLGGAYGVGRNRGWFGNNNNVLNSTVDNYNNKFNQLIGRNTSKNYASPYPTQMIPATQKQGSYIPYNYLTVEDLLLNKNLRR